MVAERIKELRLKKNLTQKQVADYLGMSVIGYAHYEWGDNEPKIEVVKKLCDLFEVSADYLIGRSDN